MKDAGLILPIHIFSWNKRKRKKQNRVKIKFAFVPNYLVTFLVTETDEYP